MATGLDRARARWTAVAVATMLVPLVAVGVSAQSATAAAGGGTRSISSSGTAVFTNAPAGVDGYQAPEIQSQSSDSGATPTAGNVVDRSNNGNRVIFGPNAAPGHRAGANAELTTSFDGLFHRQQRLANGGNQFSVEPPDQGLCVGNGFVMEAVNDVARVYDSAGNPLTAVQDLNTFLGYPAAVHRPSGPFGPNVTDPNCMYDAPTHRWFLVVLTLDTNPKTGHLTGPNHIDIAVSTTPSPTGSWTVFRLPVQDDGTQGTPDHGCSLTAAGTGHGPCIGDYPHIGADTNGFFVTTNEYSLFGPEFHGAQIYAFSKAALASGSSTLNVTQFDTHGLDRGNSGFTLWPSTSPTGRGDSSAGGTEYFMSSNAGSEAHGNGTGPAVPSNDLLVWALTNTSSLNGFSPALALSNTVVPVNTYAPPPPSAQKVGSTPLRDCINNAAGDGCDTFLLGAPDPFAPEPEYKLDSNDSRMQQVTFADGKLWGALDTALTINSANQAGVEWFIVTPSVKTGSITASLFKQGYLGVANNNLIYPALGVTHGGRGVMAFTVVGADNFPSAGYAGIDENNGVGDIHLAAVGAGPADGFSGYRIFGNPPDFAARPRWGDYGAAVADGDNMWIASEYIGQTCDLATYEGTATSPFGSCNGTRSTLANWDTRISEIAIH